VIDGESREELRQRLASETKREPIFEQYQPATMELAIISTLERIEEWDYEADPHGWCHERPLLIALVEKALT
jgi:hypothetical protein